MATSEPGSPGPQATVQPAPISCEYSGSYIAEIKVFGKGAKNHYKLGTKGKRAVVKRSEEVPPDYRRKAVNMDRTLGEEGEGPCQRRLAELPILPLCWGAYGEGSDGVHNLVALLATCRVRTLTMQGHHPGPHQMGLEVTTIRHRLCMAAVRANNTLLLARMGQVGEGSSLASKR